MGVIHITNENRNKGKQYYRGKLGNTMTSLPGSQKKIKADEIKINFKTGLKQKDINVQVHSICA